MATVGFWPSIEKGGGILKDSVILVVFIQHFECEGKVGGLVGHIPLAILICGRQVKA